MNAYERIYRAMHQLQRDHIPLGNFVVRAHPSVVEEIKVNSNHIHWTAGDGMLQTFAGLPFDEDEDLDRDAIVLRYEVVA